MGSSPAPQPSVTPSPIPWFQLTNSIEPPESKTSAAQFILPLRDGRFVAGYTSHDYAQNFLYVVDAKFNFVKRVDIAATLPAFATELTNGKVVVSGNGLLTNISEGAGVVLFDPATYSVKTLLDPKVWKRAGRVSELGNGRLLVHAERNAKEELVYFDQSGQVTNLGLKGDGCSRVAVLADGGTVSFLENGGDSDHGSMVITDAKGNLTNYEAIPEALYGDPIELADGSIGLFYDCEHELWKLDRQTGQVMTKFSFPNSMTTTCSQWSSQRTPEGGLAMYDRAYGDSWYRERGSSVVFSNSGEFLYSFQPFGPGSLINAAQTQYLRDGNMFLLAKINVLADPKNEFPGSCQTRIALLSPGGGLIANVPMHPFLGCDSRFGAVALGGDRFAVGSTQDGDAKILVYQYSP